MPLTLGVRVRLIVLTLVALCLTSAASRSFAEPCADERSAAAAFPPRLNTADAQEATLQSQIDNLNRLLEQGPHLSDHEITTILYGQHQRLEAAKYHWPGGAVSDENWNDWIELTQDYAAVAYLERLQRLPGAQVDVNDNPLLARLEVAQRDLTKLRADDETIRSQARGAQLAAIDCIVRNQSGPPQVAETVPPPQQQVTGSQQPEAYTDPAQAQPRSGGRIHFRPMTQNDAAAMAGAVDTGGASAQPQEIADFHLKGFWEVQSMQNGPWQLNIEIDLNPISNLWTASRLSGGVSQLKARGGDVVTADEFLLQGTISADRNQIRWNDGEVWRRTDRDPLRMGAGQE